MAKERKKRIEKIAERQAHQEQIANKMSKKEMKKAAKLKAKEEARLEEERRIEAAKIAFEREQKLSQYEAQAKEQAEIDEQARRYQGYDVEELTKEYKDKPKRWFWKILFISLVLSSAIIVALLVVALIFNKKQNDYISSINENNTLEALMDGKKNLQITISYNNTIDDNDYTVFRQIRKDKKGELYCYTKVTDSDADYKEVMAKGAVYRSDDSYTYYYAMIGDEYGDRMAAIDDDLFTIAPGESVVQQSEGSGIVNIKTRYEVQAGDTYTERFGCNPGEYINRSITLDTENNHVNHVTETYNEVDIVSYSVESDVENKTPNFYQKVLKAKSNRKCMIYYDYEGDGQKIYQYEVPTEVYFTMFDHEGFTAYMDQEKTKEFTEFEMQSQNPEKAMVLYMVKTGQ